jgi:uncharacterized protein YegL
LGNLIDLTKKAQIVLEKKSLDGIQANIIVAMDISGSMSYRFSNGTVQELVDRLLGIGMNIDMDKSIDMFTFNTSAKHIGAANESNYSNFVKSKKITVSGGTSYAPVMNHIISKVGSPIDSATISKQVESKGFFGKLFGKKEIITEEVTPGEIKSHQHPTIVFFVTDGDNDDKQETIRVMKEASKQAIFWQFIGIGGQSFPFLQKLDDLEGRFLDNADFFAVNDILSISDEDLYDRILNEIPSWLQAAKRKNIVI